MIIPKNQTKFKTEQDPFRNLLVRRLFVFFLSFLIIFNFSLGNAWAIKGQNVKGQNIPSLFWQGIKEGFAGAKEGLGYTLNYFKKYLGTDNEELYNKNVAREGKNKQLDDDEKKTIEDSAIPLTTIVTTTDEVTTTITTPANIPTATTTTPTTATTTNNNY